MKDECKWWKVVGKVVVVGRREGGRRKCILL